jgi:hypothetical protein
MSEPISERAFITALAKMIESEAWLHLARWYRAKSAERMLDAKTGPEREQVALEHAAALGLLRAIENEVTSKRGLIDGRTTRYAAPAGAGSAAAKNRTAAATQSDADRIGRRAGGRGHAGKLGTGGATPA